MDYWSENDPEVVQFEDGSIEEVCQFCYADEYAHESDCPVYGKSIIDEEVELLSDCE